MVERTLVLIKPDGFRKGFAVTEAIKQRYADAGMRLLSAQVFHFDEDLAEDFYQEHKGRFYFDGLVLAMASGPLMAMVLEGENAIEKVRELNGPTDPSQAPEGTIRHDFRSAGGPFNTVHGSDSQASAEREIYLCFGKRTW